MLELRDLRKSYGSTVAVDGVTLRIERGEIFGLLGPNGAGKTTTIGMSVGLIEPDGGEVRLGELGAPSSPAVRRSIGVAPQTNALYEEMSARENLDFFGRVFGVPGAERRRRTGELLERVGLGERSEHRVKTFSGGMKRRLNLAAALVHNPPLVLLDEPTAGVDPQSRNLIFDLVRALRAEGRTVVYTTHYMDEAQRLCDRVAIMDHGRVLALDTVPGLIGAHGGHTVVTVERTGGEERIETDEPLGVLSRVMGTQNGHEGGQLMGVRVDRPDLEGVFLHLTGRTLRD